MSSTIKNVLCKTCLILIIGFTFLTVPQALAQLQTVELRVDGDNGSATPPGLGDDWGLDAFKYLQDALAEAEIQLLDPDVDIVELWVAATIAINPYVPDRDAAFPNGTGDQSATFLLDFNNVTLLGGFLGDETDPGDRNPAIYITVLSGGIFSGECGDPLAGDCFEPNGSPSCDDLCNGAECPGCCEAVCDMDPICCILPWDETCVAIAIGTCSPLAPPADPLNAAYHVVTADGVDDSVRIDGFKITLGFADGGAGDDRGAGMFISNASPAVVRIIFTENAAPVHGGGAMNVTGTSDPLVVNCEFIANTGNEAGAIHTEGGSAGGTFVNCLFIDNHSEFEGGAINPGADGDLNFINCTFADNTVVSAVGGGAIFTEPSGSGAVNLINCILWGNLAGVPGDPNQIEDSEGVVTVTYSDVEGGWPCPPGMPNCGNLDDDPLFVDAPNGDYRLDALSPCIDFGDPDQSVIPPDTFDINNDDNDLEPTPDLDLFHRVLDGDDNGVDRVDMGAYEFIHPNSCPWDLDGGGFVGAGDLLLLLASWGNPFGAADLLALLAAWGPCPCCSFVPPSFPDELAAACLSNDDWQEFLDALGNGTPAEQENYICWLTHYFEDCNKCICIGASGCPRADPFN